ncbi:interleukin-2 receptor subunit beta [Pempheris klunzingeri]|uniref:interleukin-2 receptor subunit beta n=1 Tax=Pempheris klunzingeri TaxID=3127111 RepID=UPI00397F0A7D
MQILWSFYILVVLCSVDAAHSHEGSQGLSCVNDFINNVSCTWNSSLVAPGEDCWIFGVKKTWNHMKLRSQIVRSCKLNQHQNSPPGCSLHFENQIFNSYDKMPNISMECNGTLVEILKEYHPVSHIKMHPPGVPNVSSTANVTWISWSPGSPITKHLTVFNFQVQIKNKGQTWKEARTLSTQERKLKINSWQLEGHCQVRVRVKPSEKYTSHWSNWSPATSWVGETNMEVISQDQGWILDQTWLLMWGVMFSFGLILVVMLVLYRSCTSRGLRKGKLVPNPSKYFYTLHSVHGGNLKTWLNPASASESFFMTRPCDHISTVEVCESWDVVPSTSPSSSSTSALLHFRSYPSPGSDTSGVADNFSSSSSSCFSNMGYFMSSSSSSSARTEASPAYFTYQDDFHNLHTSHNLHPSLCPSLTISPKCDSLKREPQSPDSGFDTGKEDEKNKEDKKVADVEGEEVLDDLQSSPLLILPLQLPSQICPPSSLPPPPNDPCLNQVSHDSHQVDTPVAAASGSYAAWPLAGAMCRSSSMPVEPCKTGYLTLKELQTTFSNKSI